MEFCNEKLKHAIDLFRRERTEEARLELSEGLVQGTLLLAVPDCVEVESAADGLASKSDLPALTTASENGGHAVLAFTDEDALRARAVESRIVAMAARHVLELVADGKYDGLVVNPAGRWIGLTREDIARILENGA